MHPKLKKIKKRISFFKKPLYKGSICSSFNNVGNGNGSNRAASEAAKFDKNCSKVY